MKLFKRTNKDFVEYIESLESFIVTDIHGRIHEGFTWGRISKPSNIVNTWTFRNTGYLFLSSKLSEKNSNIFDIIIDEKEYKRLKKITNINKKITFTNPAVINIAIWTLGIATFGLILNFLTNYDKISNTVKLLLQIKA